MKIKSIYFWSILIGYFTFVICGMIFMSINNGLWQKGLILLVTGGVLYSPIYAMSNLTQFLLVKYPQNIKLAFFSSIVIITIISFIGIQWDMMDEFLWKLFIPSQTIASVFGFYYYRKLNL